MAPRKTEVEVESLPACLAGHGTRLRPITDSIPKCLVPIRGVPLLEVWLQLCARSGISEVLINLHSNADAVRQALRRKRTPVKVQIVDEESLLGSAGTVYANRDWVASETTFWILYADVLTTADLGRMADFHHSRWPLATLGLYQVADPTRCGVAVCDADGVIRAFEEKPTVPRSNWAFSGLMLANTKILEMVPNHKPADIGFDLLPRLVGNMLGYPIHEYLSDIGTMEKLSSRRKPRGLALKSWGKKRPNDSSDSGSLCQPIARGVVFDMDGVIVDSHPAHRKAWRHFLRNLGREVSERDLDFILDGRKRCDILRHFLG